MTLDELLNRIPRAVLVSLVLLIAIAVVFFNDPPATVCDAQMEVFKSSQQGFLLIDPKQAYKKTTNYTKYKEQCKRGNSPGACLQWFVGLRKLDEQLRIIPAQCIEEVLQTNTLKQVLPQALHLMQEIAWNAKPPRSRYEMRNWLDSQHINLYCKLKVRLKQQLGKVAYAQWREKLMQSLAGAEKLKRKDLWGKTLFSITCKNYLY